MDVGIRTLKANLSGYLERAARGEVIRVTDRGRPKALLGPLPGRSRVEEGVTEGWIRPGNGRRPKPVSRRFKAKHSVRELIAEDRGE